MNDILVGIIVVILLVIIYVLYFRVKIIRFYRDSCPYCVSSKPEWDKFKNSQYSNPLISVYEINTETEDGKELMKQYNLSSVPNIILVDDVKIKVYSGDRSCEDLKKFIK
jgi:uncharacterized protein YxeA